MSCYKMFTVYIVMPRRWSGTCSRTWGVPGNCSRHNAGTWVLGPASAGGAASGIIGVDECAARCRACERCRYISISHAHHQCDWHHDCNMTNLKRAYGADTFRTRRVVGGLSGSGGSEM